MCKQHSPGSLTDKVPGNEVPVFSGAFAEEGGGGWGGRNTIREQLQAFSGMSHFFALRLNLTILMFCLECSTQPVTSILRSPNL